MRRGRAVLVGALAVLCLVLVAALGFAAVRDALRDGTAEARDGDPSDGDVRALLTPWYAALERQAGAPAKVVLVGDSITEGAMVPAPLHDNRLAGMLQQLLRERQGVSGGLGYLPAFHAGIYTAEEVERTGAQPQELRLDGWGLGLRALAMPEGSTVTYPTAPATSVRVWFGRSDRSAGEAVVLVDGVDVTAAGTLSSGEPAGETISSAGAEPGSGVWWESARLPPGEHTVSVTAVAQDALFVHTGLEVLDGDEESGIHVYDAAHSGAATDDFVTEGARRGHWADVAAVDPQLVVVNLGTNADRDHEENLERVVQLALGAAPSARVLLVDGYEPGNWTPERWAEVRRAREAVAARHRDRVALLDLASQWPVLAKDGSNNQGLMVDEPWPVHPNTEGTRRMAELLADVLSPQTADR